jgi:pimeloyl-ACP methyl ester carboxylesterase/DNA-binding CsgD family transcriptional regulator
MQPPPVRYTRTSDGHDIAYTVCGEGPAFVCTPLGILNHAQLNWERPQSTGPWLSELAARFRLVNFDGRGQGLSTRGLGGLRSMADYCRDLEAVVEALELDRFVLYGGAAFAHVAVHYAVLHPEKVAALILVLASRSGAAWPRGMTLVAEENWELYLRSRLPTNLSRAEADRHAASLRQSISPEDFTILSRVFSESDVSALLPRIEVPSLVIHPRHQAWVSEDEAVKLAAAIPGSRLVLDEGGATAAEDAAGAVRHIEAFLADLPELGAPATARVTERPVNPDGLSGREIEVLRLVAAGKSNVEISEALVISPNTVVRHLSNIFAKIDVHNRTEAASYAHRHGLA